MASGAVTMKMAKRQFRVLHREFLFRVVDRELLSAHAQGGDASKLLLQFASLLIFLSAAFCVPVNDFTKPTMPPATKLIFAWSVQHFLIATTMLVVGLFAVLSWDSMFPDRRDVHVLSPLPIQPRTVMLAKVAAVATSLSLTVVSLHLFAGVIWPLAFASGVSSVPRMLAAYWITMVGSGTFVFCAVMGIQGLAAQVLPRRYFLRVSSLLQLATFCAIVSTYCLQPLLISRPILLALQQPHSQLAWSPSYWFFALFQTLSGSTDVAIALAPLAQRAWIALGLALLGTATAYALSYVRTFRRIAEEPDIVPGATGVGAITRWLSNVAFSFARPLNAAIVQFSIRTLLRSSQHRVILAFYWGVGFAVAIFFGKLPRPPRAAALDPAIPLLVPSVAILVLAVIGTRAVCAMPRELRANWIFRVMPLDGGRSIVAARRRALLALSVVPACLASAAILLPVWSWEPTLRHIGLLALLGMILVELCLVGAQKLPFTCAYLPGKSYVHAMFWFYLTLLIGVASKFAEYEPPALHNLTKYATMAGILAAVWACARIVNARLTPPDAARPQFEEEPSGQMVSLGVWDTRPS